MSTLAGFQQSMRCGSQPSLEPRPAGVILVRMNRRRCEIHNSLAEKRKGQAYRQHGSNLRFSIHRVTFMGSRAMGGGRSNSTTVASRWRVGERSIDAT